MNKYVEKSLKITGAFCAATGVVALSALVASGAAVGAVVEGFKTAGKTMKKMLTEEMQEAVCTEGKAETQTNVCAENEVEAQVSIGAENEAEKQVFAEEEQAVEAAVENDESV